MKQTLRISLVLLLAASFSLTACDMFDVNQSLVEDEDDEQVPEEPPASEAGDDAVISGWLSDDPTLQIA
jgi:hypothetical protein